MKKLIVAFRIFAKAPESKRCVPEGTLIRRKEKHLGKENCSFQSAVFVSEYR